MKTFTRTYTGYTFDELTEHAKERARETYYETTADFINDDF